MKQTLLIFDLDGTLLDTGNQISRALSNVLTRKSFGAITFEKIQSKIGLPLQIMLEQLEIPFEIQSEIAIEFREDLKRDMLGGIPVFGGVEDFLRNAVDQKCVLGIATSKPTHLAELAVEASALRNFEFIIKGTDDVNAKPRPDVIHRVIGAAKNFEHPTMFGDRIEDMQAAINAQIRGIGLAQGAHSTKELLEAGASKAFMSFGELLHSDWHS